MKKQKTLKAICLDIAGRKMTFDDVCRLVINSESQQELVRIEKELTKLDNKKKRIMLKMGLAWNYHLPEILMKKLSEDDDENVRAALTINISVPKEIMENLAKDSDESVSKRALKALREKHPI